MYHLIILVGQQYEIKYRSTLINGLDYVKQQQTINLYIQIEYLIDNDPKSTQAIIEI